MFHQQDNNSWLSYCSFIVEDYRLLLCTRFLEFKQNIDVYWSAPATSQKIKPPGIVAVILEYLSFSSKRLQSTSFRDLFTVLVDERSSPA